MPIDFFGRHLGALLVFVGWIMSAIGLIELNKAWHSHSTPQPVQCNELATHGPTAGLYVRLTNYNFAEEGILLQHNEEGEWLQADIPLSAHDGHAPIVIARLARDRMPPDTTPEQLLKQPLSGLVREWEHWPEGRQALNQLNPGFDPAACIVLDVGTQPPNIWAFNGIVAGGIGLFALGIVLLAISRSPTGDVLRVFIPLVALFDGARWLSEQLPGKTPARGLLLAPLAALLFGAGAYGIILMRNATPLEQMSSDRFLIDIASIIAINFGAGFVLLSLYWLATDGSADSQSESAKAA